MGTCQDGVCLLTRQPGITSWKIGAKSGIYTDAEKAYTIYIKYA